MQPNNAPQQLLHSPYLMLDPGASGTITTDRQLAVVPVVTAAAEARTLAQPTKVGLICSVVLDTDGGDLTLTVTGGFNADAATSITLADAGDFVAFLSIKVGASYYWRVLAQEGTNAAAEDFSVDQLTAITATITTLGATTATIASQVDTVASAEHGAGAIGTGVTPTTSRRTVNGTIITEIKIDLTGLASVATGDDVIGKTGAAYIGRNVVANNGIIYKMELICLETPAGGDTDINVVANAAADIEKDGAGGTTYGVNGGAQAAGQVVANLVQGLTANHYFYLTAGTGSAGTYTAGQLIVRLYGHALLA